MNRNFEKELYKIIGERHILEQEPMSKHTTFRIGGPVSYLVMPQTIEEVGQVLQLCKAEKVSCFILGHGSNLLVSDAGIDGIVLQLDDNFSNYTVEDNEIRAQSGVMLSKLAKVARNEGLTGFEFAAGIPGTLGGAVVMNAGAYGGEMKDVISGVQLMDRDGGLFSKSCEEMEFSYRHSLISENDYIVLGATLNLQPGDKEAITARMTELAETRRAKQPLEYPSAGSTFKRPEGYFAGKLIMDAGLRGYRVGDAQISEKHCGFVINRGHATSADVRQLIVDVQTKVYEKFQVRLETEIKQIGI